MLMMSNISVNNIWSWATYMFVLEVIGEQLLADIFHVLVPSSVYTSKGSLSRSRLDVSLIIRMSCMCFIWKLLLLQQDTDNWQMASFLFFQSALESINDFYMSQLRHKCWLPAGGGLISWFLSIYELEFHLNNPVFSSAVCSIIAVRVQKYIYFQS